jgi:hypothetical protein
MKKNKTLPRLSFFKTTLFILMASSFSISNSYGRDELIKKESFDSTRLNVTYRVPQATWNWDIKNAQVKVQFAIDKEDREKPYRSFLFFRFCKKPDAMWFFGRGEWKKYKEGEAPNVYGIGDILTPIPLGVSNVEISPFISMGTNSIDISSLVNLSGNNCGELVAGYGLGTTSQEAYDEMLSQKRFNVVFDTLVGPKDRVYHLELKAISTYNSPPFVGVSICTRIGCP